MKKKKNTKFLDTYHQCDTAIEPATPLYEKIPAVVRKLMKLLDDKNSFSHVEPIPIPSYESVVQLIHQARRILFPGYFTQSTLAQANLESWVFGILHIVNIRNCRPDYSFIIIILGLPCF